MAAHSLKNIAIVAVTAPTRVLAVGDQDALLRFTHASAKTLSLPANFDDAALDSTFTIRNASATNLTITPDLDVILNQADDAEIILPHTTAQLLYLGNDVWDLL